MVLVFWCLITVRCVEIFLSELFQYRAFATPYKAWTLLYSYTPIQTLNKSINSTEIPLEKFLKHPFNICRKHKPEKDVIRHHQTSANAIWCQHKSPQILEQPFWVSGNVCWCCLVSVGVCCCPEVSRDTWKRCLKAFGWSVWMFVGFELVRFPDPLADGSDFFQSQAGTLSRFERV